MSQKKIDAVLACLYANKGDMVKTSEETGVAVTQIGRIKRNALRAGDLLRIKQSKEFLEVTHKFLIHHIKSDQFKEQVRNAPLKEVTELITKLIDKLKEYQESLGIAGVKFSEVKDEEIVGKSRKPEEISPHFSLVGSLEDEKSKEVKDLTPPKSVIEGEDIFTTLDK
jgi:hypothetical protein